MRPSARLWSRSTSCLELFDSRPGGLRPDGSISCNSTCSDLRAPTIFLCVFDDPLPDPESAGQVDGQTTPEALLAEVYDELRRLAAHRLAHEQPGQTLQATALVHEAWLRLNISHSQKWNNRGHFFSAAAEAMRRILIDRARKRGRKRHGHGLERVELDHVVSALETDDAVLLRIDEALEKLAIDSPEKAELVKLRYFTGLRIQEAADAMGISATTAKRHWAFARAWLYAELSK